MSITLKIVDLMDKLKIQNYFVERDNRTYFTPVRIKFNSSSIESFIDKVINVDGRAYQMNELEEKVLKELDF